MPHLLRNSVTGWTPRDPITGWARDNAIGGSVFNANIRCALTACEWLATFSSVTTSACLTTSPVGGSFKVHGDLNQAWTLGNRTHNAGSGLVFWYYQTNDKSDLWAECFGNTTCTGTGGDLWKWFTIMLRVNYSGTGILYAYLTANDIDKTTGFADQQAYFLFISNLSGLSCLTDPPQSVSNATTFVPLAVSWKGDCITPGSVNNNTDENLSRMMGQGSASIEVAA